jgi:hypothetical protein
MPRSITGFRAALVGSGTRPNLFQIVFAFPPLATPPGNANGLVTLLAQATSIPVDKVDEIEVSYMGRKVYYPGDRLFEPWTITILNDENFVIRDSFEFWLSALNAHDANIRDPLASTPKGYTAFGQVQQLAKVGDVPLKIYQMEGFFPVELGAIELDWGTNNTIEKFTVTLRYQWWSATGVNGPTTDDGGQISTTP